MKLSALPIILIGLAVAVVVVAYAYFLEFARNNQQAAYFEEQKAEYETVARGQQAAEKRTEQAEKMVREKEEAWGRIAASRTLPGGLPTGINLNQNAWQISVDAPKFRNSVQRAVNAQLKRGGVTVLSGPLVPSPDLEATSIVANYFNFPAIPFPVVIFDLGTVTIRGTYKQISDNVRAWSRMPNYLAVTDGLQIQGTSPNLTATYSLSIVGYINAEGIFPAVPEGGGASGGGPGGPSGPGGPGGPGGGGPLAPRGGPGAPPLGAGVPGPPARGPQAL